MNLEQLIKENKKFRKEILPKYEKKLKKTTIYGQKPEILFISCSDSRINPELMMGIKPGDMFSIRNVGNFVPKYDKSTNPNSTASAIEYAVSVLKLKNIIICGHSYCGACKGLHEGNFEDDSLAHLKVWLDGGKDIKQQALEETKNIEDKHLLYTNTEKISVVTQMQNLKTFPEVKKGLEDKSLQIHAWYYHIESGKIEFYCEEDKKFKPLNKKNIK